MASYDTAVTQLRRLLRSGSVDPDQLAAACRSVALTHTPNAVDLPLEEIPAGPIPDQVDPARLADFVTVTPEILRRLGVLVRDTCNVAANRAEAALGKAG